MIKSRLKTVAYKAKRAKRLRTAGVDVSALVQTGIRSTGFFGVQVVGMALAELKEIRSAYHTAMSSPDKSSTVLFALSSVVDPAIDAHADVAYAWSQAWFSEWLPRKMISETFAAALDNFNPKSTWRSLLGLAEVTLASIKRIGWEPLSADRWRAPSGLDISLTDVAPRSVKQLISFDAEAWAWKEASDKHQHLKSLTRVPFLAPVRRLLTKTCQEKQWFGEQQAALRSIVCGAFYFQGICSLCGAIAHGRPGWHFFWECDATRAWRDAFGLPRELLAAAYSDCENSFYVSGLLPDPLCLSPPPKMEAHVEWSVVPPDGPAFCGTAFGDGGSAQGPNPRHIRCAWAVVCVATLSDNSRVVSAAACGNLPYALQAVPAAEAYALYFFLRHSVPGSDGRVVYYTDCQWVHDSWKLPAAFVTAPTACYAEIWRLIHRCAEDVGYSITSVKKIKSHRSLASAFDQEDASAVFGNQAADKEAKEATTLSPKP